MLISSLENADPVILFGNLRFHGDLLVVMGCGVGGVQRRRVVV